MKTVTVEITYDEVATSPARIRERIERQVGVWDTDNVSEG